MSRKIHSSLDKMSDAKPPKLNVGDDPAVSVRIWRKKFNAWCSLQKDWRNMEKDYSDKEHWNANKYKSEIAAFHLALPDDVLNVFDTSILPKMSQTEKNEPWKYQEMLEEHFAVATM